MTRWILVTALSLCGCAAAVPQPDPQSVGAAAEAASQAIAAMASDGSSLAPTYHAAISDPRRPEAEVARDPQRHPLEMLTFIGLEPGQRIADIRPEEGYFTRLFAPVVGPEGQVYAFVPTLTASREQGFAEGLQAEYGNVTPVIGLLDEMSFDAPLDAVFMGQEYHDFHIDRFNVDVAEMNRRVYAALRPGGIYVVLDHSGRPDTGHSEVSTLHRIEAASVRSEVEAAGFVFDGETRVLANPDDPLDISVFDESIRGRSDQFVYRFRKPEGPIADALADDRRPEEDRNRDAARQTVRTLALADVQPGDQVADLIVGGGYFTRLFSSLVGPQGHVYAWQPGEFIGFNADYGAQLAAVDAAYDNVTGLTDNFAELDLPEGALDLVFTAQNYHDFHLNPFPPTTASSVNAEIFSALRPCGRYFVIDHAAAEGTGFTASHTLHRAEEAAVRAEIEQAGFELVERAFFLDNPDDPLVANVFDPSIRGHTSQFILIFQKPGEACPVS